MAERNFQELALLQNQKGNHTCMGLDTRADRVMDLLGRGIIDLEPRVSSTSSIEADMVVAYNTRLLEIAAETGKVGWIKPNVAFYLALGHDFFWAMEETMKAQRAILPEAVLIYDAKVQDIESTNNGYAKTYFDLLKGDALTVHPYLGKSAIKIPFLDRADKGFFVLSRTSNEDGGEFQDLYVREKPHSRKQEKMFEYVARRVANNWNEKDNCGLVAGATYPDESKIIREIVGPKLNILFPGVGAQGGSATEVTVRALRSGEHGLISSSRKVIDPELLKGEDHWAGVKRNILSLSGEISTAQNQAV